MNSRRHIISAARRVFAEKGYRGASLRDISTAAGIQRGSVYHHVESKEELLLETVLPALRMTVSEVKAVLAVEGDPATKLRRAIEAHLRCLYGNSESREGVQVYLNEDLLAPSSPLTEAAKSELRTLSRLHESLWTELFEEGIAQRAFGAGVEPKLLAFLVLGMCNWIARWYRPDGGWSLSHLSATVADVVLDGVRAGTPPGRVRTEAL